MLIGFFHRFFQAHLLNGYHYTLVKQSTENLLIRVFTHGLCLLTQSERHFRYRATLENSYRQLSNFIDVWGSD